ncbi:MAG: hypothetical protein JWM86_1387, partial [Thermoleophilia bacterium]|nr:hypothetical protein [Thermoleophilia bacterium]
AQHHAGRREFEQEQHRCRRSSGLDESKGGAASVGGLDAIPRGRRSHEQTHLIGSCDELRDGPGLDVLVVEPRRQSTPGRRMDFEFVLILLLHAAWDTRRGPNSAAAPPDAPDEQETQGSEHDERTRDRSDQAALAPQLPSLERGAGVARVNEEHRAITHLE